MRTFLSPIISLALLLLPFIALSQQDSSRKFGISLNVNTIGNLFYNDSKPSDLYMNIYPIDKSYSLGITANYFLLPDFAIRFKASTSNRNLNSSNQDSIIYSYPFPLLPNPFDTSYSYSSLTENDLLIAIGASYQYRFKKFTLIGGLDIEYISHSKITISDTTNVLNYISTVDTYPKGNSYGVDGFIGINFFPKGFISIGCEFSTALLYTKFDGMRQHVIYQHGALYNEDIYRDVYSSFNLHDPIASLNISFWFK